MTRALRKEYLAPITRALSKEYLVHHE